MADELSRLIPDPPPPRPAARDAAIAAAMRRFDGVPEPAPAAPAPRKPAGMRWGPAGAFASVLVVALVSVPFALQNPRGPIAPAPQPSATIAARPATPAPAPPATPVTGKPHPAPAPGPAPVPAPAPTPVPAQADAAAPAPVATADKAEAEPPVVAGRVASFSAPGAAPKPSPETKMAARAVVPEPSAENEVVVTGRRREETLQSVPTAVTAISSDSLDQADGIVVTGSRVSRGRGDAAWRRGDWNACTVNDPGHSLRGCKSLVNPAAKGDTGIAAARVSDGLASAWRGEWDDAILAFDQAIALRPSFAFAYLNRALARQRKGDLAGAAADLDLAVRHAPHSARGYYHRSVLRQQMGDPRRARQDEGRAVDLDPDYADLFE